MKKYLTIIAAIAALIICFPSISEGGCEDPENASPIHDATYSAELMSADAESTTFKVKIHGPNVNLFNPLQYWRLTTLNNQCANCPFVEPRTLPGGTVKRPVKMGPPDNDKYIQIEMTLDNSRLTQATGIQFEFRPCGCGDIGSFKFIEDMNLCSLFKIIAPSNCPSLIALALATAVPYFNPFAEANTTLQRTTPDENSRVDLTIKVYGPNIETLFGKEAFVTVYKRHGIATGTGFPKTFQVNKVGDNYHIELGTHLYTWEIPGTTFIFNFFYDENNQNYEFETPEMCSLMKARADYCPLKFKTLMRPLVPFYAE